MFEEARVRYLKKNYLKTFHFSLFSCGDIFFWYAYRIYILY